MTRSLTIAFGLTIVLAAALGAALMPRAQAQDAMRIAAVVNEDAISVLDVYERSDLIFATTGLPDNAETRRRILPQVLRTLIDETLQLQEAEREGFDIEQMNLEGAYRLVEDNLGLPSGQLLSFVNYNNLSIESLDRQLQAEILWNELVYRRMQADEITDEDIDAELLRIEATANEPAYLLAEIFLSVDDPEREGEVRANMERLREAIVQGASFPQLARQFSQSASAAEGGDLGWIARSQLGDDMREAIDGLERGQISPPVRTIGGYSLILLRDDRQGLTVDPLDAEIVMRQVLVRPAGDDGAGDIESRARGIAAEIGDCAAFDALAGERPDASFSEPIAIRLGDLQPRFLKVVRDLPPEVLSAPVSTEQGLHMFMVCERSEPASGLPSREQIRTRLENQQFDLIARGYLRDLRRAAFVDVRI